MVSIGDCQMLALPSLSDERGILTRADPADGLPFVPRRIFYLHSVPASAKRAGHALLDCQQILIAVAGSLDVDVWDGENSARFHLSEPGKGVYLPPMIWRELRAFSSDAVCLVLASHPYEPEAYFRTKESFINARQSHG